ncbi:MAG: 7-carboxy-7-deazaguanine synthase [Chlamydiae bacterium]|nr:7-carboxy-7-deazaguanine synthase [Chlamydiota bacterium]
MENSLNIIEVFHSVQGESSFTGLPTTFIRLAACNLRCVWCDTSYSFGRGEPQTIEALINQVQCPYVCVTGGEPLLQKNVHLLMSALIEKGVTVSLETGGSLPIQNVHPKVHVILDIKCPGSGMSEKNLWSNLELLKPIDEVKFVIKDAEDYEYAKDILQKYALTNVLFSPVFDEMDSQTLVEWILRDHLPVRLNLQTHKFIWDPATKGV